MQTSAPKKTYKEKQTWYAHRYQVSLPTIKRWWKKDYPLDDPDAMGEYLSPAGRKGEEEFAEDPPPRDPDDIAADRLNRFGPDFLNLKGLAGAIARYRILEIEAADKLSEAMLQGNSKERMNRLNEYNSIVEHLRKIEKDNPDIESANSKTIAVIEVEEGLTKLLFDVAGRLDTLPVRGMENLVGCTAQEIRELLEAEIEKVKIPIRQCLWMPEAERAKLPAFIAPAPVPDSGTPEPKVLKKKTAARVAKSKKPAPSRKRK